MASGRLIISDHGHYDWDGRREGPRIAGGLCVTLHALQRQRLCALPGLQGGGWGTRRVHGAHHEMRGLPARQQGVRQLPAVSGSGGSQAPRDSAVLIGGQLQHERPGRSVTESAQRDFAGFRAPWRGMTCPRPQRFTEPAFHAAIGLGQIVADAPHRAAPNLRHHIVLLTSRQWGPSRHVTLDAASTPSCLQWCCRDSIIVSCPLSAASAAMADLHSCGALCMIQAWGAVPCSRVGPGLRWYGYERRELA
jgi:hypothetical protein